MPEKTLNLHLMLILHTHIACNKQQRLGKGENLIFRITTLLDSNVGFNNNINHKAYKKMAYSKGKKTTRTFPEKDQVPDLLDKEFKNNCYEDAQRTKGR